MEVFECPSCMEPTDHVVLKVNGEVLVRCGECETVHTVARPSEKLIQLRVIASRDGESKQLIVLASPSEKIRVGDEFIADDEESGEVIPIKVTSIEVPGNRRVESAQAGEVETVWARGIAKVAVKISVHKDHHTESVKVMAAGDQEYRVDQRLNLPRVGRVRITKIKERAGPLRERKGDSVLAKDVRRIYARKPKWE